MSHPLAATVARLDAREPERSVHLGVPPGETGWITCQEVIEQPVLLRRWQADAAAHLRDEHSTVPAITSAAFVLGEYAGICGFLGGATYSLDRRVPRLDAGALAFRQDPAVWWPRAFALLDRRFWCLPDDPDAFHPDATAVAGELELATVLRAQVRAHADAFLAMYEPGVRMARRHLLGAFFDGLDCGPWVVSGKRERAVADSARVLPGRTVEFKDASTLRRLVDARGREHLTRERISCCFYYRLPDVEACFTCPRTSLAERVERAATWPDEVTREPAAPGPTWS